MSIKQYLAVVATIIGLITVPLEAGARQAPLVDPERVLMINATPNPMTAAQVRTAIVAGGREHGWYVTEDKPGQVALRYDRGGKHTVVITVDYDDKGYQIRYTSSVNLNYEEVNGVREIHPNYNRWIQILIRSINANAAPR
jgi:hypothetical protein